MEKIITLKNNLNITIKECTPEYIDQLEGFLESIAKETKFTLQTENTKFTKSSARKSWQRSLDSKNETYLGAFDGNKLIGQIHFRGMDQNHPWIKHVGKFGMFILKDYWGHGIGTELIKAMIDFAKEIGIKRIEATVRSKNERALKLYEKIGFIVEGTRTKAVYIDECFQDEYYIAYLID